MAGDPKHVTGFDYRWFLRRTLPDRNGKLCRIVAQPPEHQWTRSRAHHGQIVVEFTDGYRVVTSRLAIKRLRRALP